MALTVATTPHGHTLRIHTRPETNDEALVRGILGSDEYHLGELHDLAGQALDIGAHVGTVGLALALDHPRLTVTMIEPVPDNAALIRRSIEANDLSARCTVIEAMAGHGSGTATCRYGYRALAGFADPGYVVQNAWIGNIWRLTDDSVVDSEVAEVPIVSLAELGQAAVFTKIDCEGCEWDFLRGSRLPLIVGEWHDAQPSKLRRLLRGYAVEILADHGGSGIFRATLP